MQSLQDRPLSPHIQIYKWQITSILSILHRFTGLVLCVGLGGFISWLYLLSLGEDTYQDWMQFLNTSFVQLLLWGAVFSLNFHFMNGLRHLAWDKGWGLSMQDVNKSGYFVVIFASVITMLMFIGWR